MAASNIYDEKMIDLSEAAYVKPDGEVLFGFHSKIASEFYGLNINQTEIEKEQRREYLEKLWLYMEQIRSAQDSADIELLVRYYKWDKIAPSRRRMILTTKTNMYETYFNYYLNGYSLKRLAPILFDEEHNEFYYPQGINQDFNSAIIRDEQTFKSEADEIIKTVPILERKLFYKNPRR